MQEDAASEPPNRRNFVLLQLLLSKQAQGLQHIQGMMTTLPNHDQRLNHADEALARLHQNWDGDTLSLQEQMRSIDQKFEELAATAVQEKSAMKASSQQHVWQMEDRHFSEVIFGKRDVNTANEDFVLVIGGFPCDSPGEFIEERRRKKQRRSSPSWAPHTIWHHLQLHGDSVCSHQGC